jgi:hypothetical protein
VLFCLALVLLAVLLPRRLRLAFPAAVLAVFAVTSVLAWERIVDAPEEAVFAGGLERAWIDERLPETARVTKLYYDSETCGSALARHALSVSEFFNARVDRAALVGDSVHDGLPLERVDVAEDGSLVRETGEPLVLEHAYTPPWLRLDGRELERGTAAGLVLWEVRGPARVPEARTNADLDARCR